MYENTGARAHEMAADLIAGGVDAHAIYRRLYEGIPQGKLELLARGLTNVERFDGGLLTLTHLTREDYRSTGADESYSEGVVDHLRSVEGTAVAGLVRDQLSDGAAKRKVSLRATDDRIDVSRIARAGGGGGHRRAAGFSTDLEFPALVEFLRAQVANSSRPARELSSQGENSQGREPPGERRGEGVMLVDKPAGVTSHDVVAAGAPAARRQGGPRGHARSVRHGPAARARGPRHARAALPDGAAEDVRGGGPAGLHVDDRRPRRRDRARATIRSSRCSSRPAS